MKVGIIGAGIAGLSIARDLLLNNADVLILEKDDFPKGASVFNGAVLHSGARYLVDNPRLAELCLKENTIIKEIAPFAVGKKLGIFVVGKENQENVKTFKANADKISMPIRKMDLAEVRSKVRNLNKSIRYAFETPDAIVNPFILTQAYLEEVKNLGGKIIFNSLVQKVKTANNKIEITLKNNELKNTTEVDFLINCTGKNLQEIAQLFNSKIEVENIEGAMYICDQSYSDHFVTTCAVNYDGNAIVPINGASSIGSTWVLKNESDISAANRVARNIQNVITDEIHFDLTKTISAARTHIKSGDSSRSGIDYTIYNHSVEGIDNAISVLPGKYVLHRMVAELTTDVIFRQQGIKRIASTKNAKLKEPKGKNPNFIEYTI